MSPYFQTHSKPNDGFLKGGLISSRLNDTLRESTTHKQGNYQMKVKPHQIIEINDGLFRVVTVRDTITQPLSKKTYARHPYTHRTRYLATCRHKTGKTISVYTQDPNHDIRPVSIWRKLGEWWKGRLPN